MAEFEGLGNPNPLAQYYRQPKIYIDLPSKGEFYPDGSLDLSQDGKYAVFAMTAKDELMFKTPDALLNGQSTVEVIKSCIPAIKDPWKMPSIDVDAALIAIRIATYGETMEVSSKCPSCDTDQEFGIDLTHWLAETAQFQYQPVINLGDLTINITPYSYHEITKTSLKTFEQQRIFNVINDESISDEKKIEMFGESFVKLTAMTVDIIAGCVQSIETPQGTVTDKTIIEDFINNADKSVFQAISDHVTNMKGNGSSKTISVKCESCNNEYEMPLTMDQSTFFEPGS
jgi:hypothetical protein